MKGSVNLLLKMYLRKKQSYIIEGHNDADILANLKKELEGKIKNDRYVIESFNQRIVSAESADIEEDYYSSNYKKVTAKTELVVIFKIKEEKDLVYKDIFNLKDEYFNDFDLWQFKIKK